MTTHVRLVLLAAVAVPFCHHGPRTAPPPSGPLADVRDASGTSHGILLLRRAGGGVRISGTLTGLTPGAHGIHVHSVGRCDPADFTSAGPHFNPASAHHGLDNPAGPHAGDLPNITAGDDGRATVDLTTTRVTLDAAPTTGLFDADGSAIVVHAGADDQRSDPAGNSGARVACGVVQR